MKLGILHIGDELLTGEIDPYPQEIIKTIRSRHQSVALVQVIGDDEGDILAALEQGLRMHLDLLVVTGGLGPTLDDITREAVARFLGTELYVDGEAARWAEEALARMHGRRVEMTPIRLRMARIPRGGKALRNITGAAAGIEASRDGMTILCLPGFPNEMLPMFNEHVLPRIGEGGLFEEEVWVRQGEATLEPLFEEVVQRYKVRVASLPSVNWRTEGNRVVIKGSKEDVERASAFFRERLEKLDGPSCR